MKSPKTPPTRGLVGIAMHVLFCIFILGNGRAVAIDLSITPLADSVGGFIGAELKICGNIHNSEHVNDVRIRGIKSDPNVFIGLRPINLNQILMLPVLKGCFNSEPSNLALGNALILEKSDKRGHSSTDDSRSGDNHPDKKSGLTIGEVLENNLHWWHYLGFLLCSILGGAFGNLIINPAVVALMKSCRKG
jgi:hypothetical protein